MQYSTAIPSIRVEIMTKKDLVAVTHTNGSYQVFLGSVQSFSADVQACVFRPGHVLRRVSGASDRHLNRTLRRNYSPTKIKTIHHSLCITHCCSYNLATISSHINSNASNV